MQQRRQLTNGYAGIIVRQWFETQIWAGMSIGYKSEQKSCTFFALKLIELLLIVIICQ